MTAGIHTVICGGIVRQESSPLSCGACANLRVPASLVSICMKDRRMSPLCLHLTSRPSPFIRHCQNTFSDTLTHFMDPLLPLTPPAANTSPSPTSWTLQGASYSGFNPFALLLRLLPANPHSLCSPDLVLSQTEPALGSPSPRLPLWEPVLGPRVPLLTFSGIHLAAECWFVGLLELWAQIFSWCIWEPTGIQIRLGPMWSICGFSACYRPQRFFMSARQVVA